MDQNTLTGFEFSHVYQRLPAGQSNQRQGSRLFMRRTVVRFGGHQLVVHSNLFRKGTQPPLGHPGKHGIAHRKARHL